MDIQTLAQKFYEHSLYFRGYSKQTINRYKFAIRTYCKVTEVTTIDQVTTDNVRTFFYHGRTIRDWKASSFFTIYKSLKTFFSWCKENGFIDFVPTDDIEIPKIERKLPPKLNKQEALRLLEIVYNYPYRYNYLRYRNHALFATLIFAGLRKNELLKLLYTDVDLENLTIFVRRGKGAKDRIVPISNALALSLRRYLEHRKRLTKTCPEFFTSLRGNIPFSQSGLEHFVDIIRKSAGIKFSIHKLRHTFATLMLEGGCDIYSLSQMMGHSDIQTTTIYLYASPQHLRSQITKHPLNGLM
ncbi:tyrosine-type recombinase/integrase [Niastella populi]|uniref:Integrase n=1 Tax=Niastella populi TaxID=550983 RepID=A0A1V9G6H3_9BACT|nr:tyrosine-type recombinase/integrase [Niastella populi]OQP66241.1 hypothetical protein A4R26_33525 [Niastella populi]